LLWAATKPKLTRTELAQRCHHSELTKEKHRDDTTWEAHCDDGGISDWNIADLASLLLLPMPNAKVALSISPFGSCSLCVVLRVTSPTLPLSLCVFQSFGVVKGACL
jgi:hypothetical protein